MPFPTRFTSLMTYFGETRHLMNETVGRELFLSIASRPDGVRWELRIRLEQEVGGKELKSRSDS